MTPRVTMLVLSRNRRGCPRPNQRSLLTLSNSMMWSRALSRTTTLINLTILGLPLAEPRNILINQNTNLGPDIYLLPQRRISPLSSDVGLQNLLKELEHQARQNISTLNFTTTFAKTSSSCNSTLEKCQHSLKSTFKKVKSQIRKGADPEKAAKRGYEEACEYLDLWNKTLVIQHRALTCLSKSLAHILQRELYSMGNTGLLRHEAEMTLLQPQLGKTRCQELRNASFWPASLFKSQLVKEGEDFLLKKGTSKDSQGFGPYQNNPFRGPHKKRGSYRKRPYGGNSSQNSNQSFSSGRGKPNFRSSRGCFRPHNRGRGRGNPSSQCLLQSLPQSTSRRSPLFFQERLANKQMFIKRVNHYHQWLRTAIPLKAKLGQISSDSVRIQDPSKRPSSSRLYPVSSVKERYRKGGKCKISRVLQSPVSSPQASPKVEASNRLRQAQHFSTCRKVQNGNSRVHQDLPGSRGMGIVDRPIGHLPSHPHPPKLKEIPKVLPQVTGVPVHLPSFRTSHSPPGLYNDRKESEAHGLSRGLRVHQYLDDWLIRSQSQEEAQVNTQAVVDLTQSLGWIINQEK